MAKASGLPGWKRALDLSLIVLTALLWLPVALLVAIYIKLVSPGSILFCQTRVGHRGRPFLVYKFRSMKAGADTESHKHHLQQLIRSGVPMTKMDNRGDTRLIPFGALLRATGLDELPQLINVVRGEMSLVGPRPCIPYEYEQYLPEQKRRFEAVPGLTGLWQVSGKNRTTFDEMIRLDVTYAENLSLWLDLLIILKTPAALLRQVGDAATRRVVNKPSENQVLKAV